MHEYTFTIILIVDIHFNAMYLKCYKKKHTTIFFASISTRLVFRPRFHFIFEETASYKFPL